METKMGTHSQCQKPKIETKKLGDLQTALPTDIFTNQKEPVKQTRLKPKAKLKMPLCSKAALMKPPHQISLFNWLSQNHQHKCRDIISRQAGNSWQCRLCLALYAFFFFFLSYPQRTSCKEIHCISRLQLQKKSILVLKSLAVIRQKATRW